MTAAHRIFPFGSIIVVENLENGRKVTLTINDRGPYAANRVLDVSKAAADALGFLNKGTVYARITLLKLGNNKTSDIAQEPQAASSSSSAPALPSTPVKASPAPLTLPVLPLPAPVLSPSAPSNGSRNYQAVITTNVMQVLSTNQVILTNYIAVPVTNIVNIEPYEEKTVENGFNDSNTNNFAPLPQGSDEFVMDESSLKTGTPPAPAPTLDTENNSNVTFTEKEVSPEPPDTNQAGVILEKPSDKGYIVQAGAFTSEKAAMKLYDLLKKNNYDVFTSENAVHGQTWIRVKIGYFSSLAEAKSVSDELKKFKINALVLKGSVLEGTALKGGASTPSVKLKGKNN